MEFDDVIVVEPALIVEEAAGGQGLRELYVALTADDDAGRRARLPPAGRTRRILTRAWPHSPTRRDEATIGRVEPRFDERDVAGISSGIFYMNGYLAQIADELKTIRLLLEDGDEEEEAKKTSERALTPEFREGFERSQKMLAERIAYYEARIAARERGENPDAGTA